MKKIALVVAGLAALSACAPSTPQNLVDVEFTSRAAQNVVGYNTVNIRTRLRGSGDGTSEITGVPCTLTGSGFRAAFQSSAAVNVPVYGRASRAIQVACTYEGETEMQTMPAVNLTEQEAVGNGASGGLIGVLVMAAAVSARTDRADDSYGYNEVRLTFDP